MNEQDKIKGIVAVFERIADEMGLTQDKTEDCKCRIGKMLDRLVGPCWRYEVNLHTPMGGDPFGGGWMPDMDVMDKPDAHELDEMYRRMRLLARDRGMAETRLEHMPSEMDHGAYAKVPDPVSKVIKVVVTRGGNV